MSKWFTRSATTRYVDHGRVRCPVEAKDVDVESCLSCPFLTDLKAPEGALTEVVCRPAPRPLTGAVMA